MSIHLHDDSALSAVADAIRAKAGTSAQMTVSQMPSAISNISTGMTPSGKLNITDTAEKDVTNYAKAQVVDANLVAGNIKSGTSILGITGTYSGGGGGGSMPSWLITGVITPVSNTKSITIPLNAGVRPTFAAIYKVDMDEDLGSYNQLLAVGLRGDSDEVTMLTTPMGYTGWNGTIDVSTKSAHGVTDFDATKITFVTRDANTNYAYKAGKAYRYIICLKEVTV